MGYESDVNAVVVAEAYDENFIFINTTSTKVESVIKIGPKETRRLSFGMTLLPGALEGIYRVDVTAKSQNRIEGVKVPVYINVEE